MTAADYLMLISMVCIWALMAINVFLSVGGFLYYHQCSKTDGHVPIDEYPFVSIMVPAHNESVVIRRTVRAQHPSLRIQIQPQPMLLVYA